MFVPRTICPSSAPTPSDRKPQRAVYEADALAWLDNNPAQEGMSVVTSLPDVCEIPSFDLPTWRTWFLGTARRILRWLPEDGVAIFFQSDIRHQGRWIDKGHLIHCAVDEEAAWLLFHKIVCRHPPGTITYGRASYSHLLCASRKAWPMPKHPGPDVLEDAGYMSWARAMGEAACALSCRFLQKETNTRIVVDPFCGEGSVLVMANHLGLDAIGIDRSAKRCRRAQARRLEA